MQTEYPPLATRYDRDSWLRLAMDVLAREGETQLSTERLAQDLGVTRGSFYHHFKSREDFVRALLRYWSTNFTERVVETVQSAGLPPRERIFHLMKMIQDEGIDRYDVALRSWALKNPKVAEELRAVDIARYDFVRGLFADLGFDGHELEERTRLFIVYESKQSTVYFPDESRNRPGELERRLSLYTTQPEGGH